MQPAVRHLTRLSTLVTFMLAWATVLPAVTEVTLNSPATPSVADPSVTNVTVVGRGFPSGTIPASNVTVTIAPTTAGTGPSGTTTALSVTLVSGTTEKVTFRVPSTISVTTATSYQISIAGTTSTGTAFQSSNSAQLTINPLVTITTSSPLPSGTVGKSYSDTLEASGGTGSYTWSVNTGSTLPGGLSLNSATGVLSGTPTTAGTSHVTFKATDTDGLSAGKSLSITITAPLTITTGSPLPTGTVGVSYSDTFAASGGSGNYRWVVSAGALPGGLALNSSTGVLSGVPTTAGTPSFTIRVTDTSTGATASKPFTMTIDAAITITTSSPLPTGTVGVTYSQTLMASGGSGSYTWSVISGSLPAGLGLNSATGLISGQPTTAGTPGFTVQVTDTDSATASKAFTVTINPALTITTASPLPTGTVGVNYSQTLMATGGSGSYTWSVSVGSLPGGLTLNSATGLISGQPTTAGTPSFTIQVTDSNQVSTTKPFTVTINAALTITTNSPLPTGTVGVNYSQTLMATGGSGSYKWSVSAGSLPAGLSLNTATGLISGQPSAAGAPGFTIQVTDTNQVSTTKPFTVTINPAITITTSSPLPNGEVGIPYAQTLMATGGSGTYTWSVSVGTLPAGLTLASSTGTIGGQPTTQGTSNFTILATDTNQATASQPFVLTINPAATLQTLSPNSANAGVQLAVTITGLNTNFVQGTTVANFGPGISVGGGTAGQPGPVTVNSATSATAEISINSTATTGSQTVTVATGAEQESLTNGFTILASVPIITVTTTATTPLAQGFSGFDDEYLINGVEYWDPKYLAMVEPLKPGWVRFPSGSPSMAFDWQAAHLNSSWISELEPLVNSFIYEGLEDGQELTQAKGGSCFSGGTCVSDYKTFLQTTGANGLVVLNGFTDTNSNSAGKMVSAAQSAGMNIVAWELDNEPYCCPKIYSTAGAYAAAAYNPYYLNVNAANPSAIASDFMEGEFSGLPFAYQTWDTGITTYSPEYWQAYSYHVYAITNETISTSDEEQTLNGILAHGTTEYFDSYVEPLIGPNLPVFISELNSDGFGTLAFESYIYNALFLAEYIARMSSIPQVKAVGVTELYLGNSFNQGVIRAVNDYESYLKAQVKANPNYSTNTATNPNTQFQFYYSTNALALEVANTAINGSNATWATVVNGGPTVPIEGYDGNPIPAVFAQGYQGTGGQHYLLVTNKSNAPVQMAVEVDGNLLQQTLALTYISSTSDTAQNTATNQTAVQIQTATSPNPVTIGPYSVTLIQW